MVSFFLFLFFPFLFSSSPRLLSSNGYPADEDSAFEQRKRDKAGLKDSRAEQLSNGAKRAESEQSLELNFFFRKCSLARYIMTWYVFCSHSSIPYMYVS